MTDTGYPALPVPGYWRQARSEHICVECGQSIAVGSRYFCYTGGTPDFESGHAYDRQCAIRAWLPAVQEQPAAQGKPKVEVSIVMALSEECTLIIYLDGSIAVEGVVGDDVAAIVLSDQETRRLLNTLTLWFGAREKPRQGKGGI